VRAIVQRHGGTIVAYNDTDGPNGSDRSGAVFEIILPSAPE
jgi:signal transduction histidine kinase